MSMICSNLMDVYYVGTCFIYRADLLRFYLALPCKLCDFVLSLVNHVHRNKVAQAGKRWIDLFAFEGPVGITVSTQFSVMCSVG
jgi:hypothetical protein